jgi:hypothetical protein
MKIKFLCLILPFAYAISYSQTTVGLLFNDLNVSEGYTLFTPQRNNEVFLMDNCGQKIHQWTFTETPGATCYLLPNSNLLRAGKDNLEIRDWSNNIIWSYPTTSNGIAQHHDIEPLPNGNILCIVSDVYTLANITAEGRNPAITDTTFKVDKIIELQPIGINNANIVWEWKFIDHFIQDFDATKQNYGIVQNHPELLDINFVNNQIFDYTHLNAIDYNPNLDQIIISARHLSEVYIIDHSTTTLQAASNTGGNSNKGGDFLWRWGNSQVYKQGTTVNQKLFLQHDCKWVETGYLDAGKISVFNNDGDGSGTFSSIHIISPEILNGIYTKTNSIFNPQNFEFSWNGSILGTIVNEGKQSGVQSLTNGNLLICETSSGRISEITKTGTHLWSYKNPTGPIINSNYTIYTQNSSISSNINGIFRAEKYPLTYAGFNNLILNSNGIIENLNTVSNTCITLNSDVFFKDEVSVINPIKSTLLFNKKIENYKVTIYDSMGRIVFDQKSFTGDIININLSSSIYFMHLTKDNIIKKYKLLVK